MNTPDNSNSEREKQYKKQRRLKERFLIGLILVLIGVPAGLYGFFGSTDNILSIAFFLPVCVGTGFMLNCKNLFGDGVQ